jgi:flagellar protein FliS
MQTSSAVFAYQQSAARGASPVGMVISLYETILRDFHRALAAITSGNVESRVFELNHALTVIAHLQSILDHQRGGEAAIRLERFYNMTKAMVLEANVSASREILLKLLDLYGGLRQAWEQADQQLSGSGNPVSANPSSSTSTVPGAPSAPPHPAKEASENRGRWSA